MGYLKELQNMFFEDELFLAYKIGNGQVMNMPFPHMYIENIFPLHIYEAIQNNLPESNKLEVISKKRPVIGYKERFVFCFDDESLLNLDNEKRIFWEEFKNRMLSKTFMNFLLSRFMPYISSRFQNQNIQQLKFNSELLLIQDTMNYKIGPHTDSPRKVISFLFYLPKDYSQKELGTSIYMPKDFNFKCNGGPHHPRENFEKITTMPFLPNSLFCFPKTDDSFHGVEKIETDEKRWLLLYDIYIDQSDELVVKNQAISPGKFSWQ
jgi:hypothetical protein